MSACLVSRMPLVCGSKIDFSVAIGWGIQFQQPLFLVALSVPLLGEKVGWRRGLAVLAGFLGVVVMIEKVRSSSPSACTTLPAPWHLGQVCWMEKKPWAMRTWPAPSQVLQVTGFVPGRAPEPLQVSQFTCVGRDRDYCGSD